MTPPCVALLLFSLVILTTGDSSAETSDNPPAEKRFFPYTHFWSVYHKSPEDLKRQFMLEKRMAPDSMFLNGILKKFAPDSMFGNGARKKRFAPDSMFVNGILKKFAPDQYFSSKRYAPNFLLMSGMKDKVGDGLSPAFTKKFLPTFYPW